MTSQELDSIFSKLTEPTTTLCTKRTYEPGLFGMSSSLPHSVLAAKSRETKVCSLHPKRVIFNPPATIVEWEDGTKTVVKCHDDTFHEEFGFAMAVMRKIYGSRKNFMAQFKDAHRPYLNPKKAKKMIAEQADAGVQN